MHAPGRMRSSRQNDVCVHVVLLGTQEDGGYLLTWTILGKQFPIHLQNYLVWIVKLVQDFFRISENVLSLFFVIFSWKWVLGFSFSSRSCLIASYASMPILWASRRSLCYVWRCYGTWFTKCWEGHCRLDQKGLSSRLQESSQWLVHLLHP